MTATDWGQARIIFVCSGNICRSPMAEGLARMMFGKLDMNPLIISMGTLGLVGRPAAERAVEVSREIGVDISHHASQGLSAAMLEAADVVFAMTPRHLEEIAQQAPRAAGKVQLLSDYVDDADDIFDPIGGSTDDFIDCRDLIWDCLEGWFDAIGLQPPE